MRSYEEFKDAIRCRENSRRYDTVNVYGYLGAYQFGMARLCDLGLTRRIPGQKGMLNACFEWVPPYSKEGFLGDHALQDLCFDRHVSDLARRVRLVYSGKNVSGAIAASHLVGFQSLLEYLHHGRISKDANGVSVQDYFQEFDGFEIP